MEYELNLVRRIPMGLWTRIWKINPGWPINELKAFMTKIAKKNPRLTPENGVIPSPNPLKSETVTLLIRG